MKNIIIVRISQNIFQKTPERAIRGPVPELLEVEDTGYFSANPLSPKSGADPTFYEARPLGCRLEEIVRNQYLTASLFFPALCDGSASRG